jgi:hypothetical protein
MAISRRAPVLSRPGMGTGRVVPPRAILREAWWLNRTLVTAGAEPAVLVS